MGCIRTSDDGACFSEVKEFHDNVIDTAPGFMDLCLAAVDIGLAEVGKPGT